MPVEIEPDETPDGWYYGNQQSIEDFLGIENLRIASNLEGDETATDTDRILRDGLESDAYINSRLRGGVYKVPITVDGIILQNLDPTHDTRLYFQSISDREVARRLHAHRLIQSAAMADEDVAKLMIAWRDHVAAELADVKSGKITIVADLNTTGLRKARPITIVALSTCCKRHGC